MPHVKTDLQFELEDDLDRGRTEVMLEARRWARRKKNEVELKILAHHKRKQLTGKKSKPLSGKTIKIIDA